VSTMTPEERRAYMSGWHDGVQHMRVTFRYNLSPWTRLRQRVNRMVNEANMHPFEKSAYRTVQRWMSPRKRKGVSK
jgi:hypothetical protein